MTKTKQDLTIEATKEAEFFDKYYADADKKQEADAYLVPEKLIRQVTHPDPRRLREFDYAYSLLGKLEGKKLLDYGAGDGWNAICFAKAKAKISAIDISEKGVELIRKKAAANGVGQFIKAEVRNCYKTEFPANEFDIVYGGGILHHLDIEESGKEISRILHPDGIAVFFEPIRDTRIMDKIKAVVMFFLKKRKPLEETENESPMTSHRINKLKPYFRVVNYRHFNALTSIGLLIDIEIVKWFLMWCDFFLMALIPGFKKLGRAVVIELREPIKK